MIQLRQSVLFILLLISQNTQAEIKNVLHLTDIHLDTLSFPSSGCGQPKSASQLPWIEEDFPSFLEGQRRLQLKTNGTYGQFGCDSTPALFSALLEQLTLICSQTTCDAIVVSGDEAAHHLNSSQTLLAMKIVAQKLQELPRNSESMTSRTSPNPACQNSNAIPLYFALGNNDVAPDYHFTCNGSWYELVRTTAWSDVIPWDQLASWNRSGSYTIADPFCSGNASVALIVLNSVLYSNSRTPPFLLQDDPCGQFAWLKAQMQSDLDTVNFFLGHIPPGIDSFNGKPFYRKQFNNEMFDIFLAAQSAQSMGFFGHRHTDEFRSFFGKVHNSPTLPAIAMQAAISPIFGNNPSFRIYQYDVDSSMFLDYVQFVFDLEKSNSQGKPVWFVEYRFQEAYNLSNVTSSAYVQLFQQLQQNSTILQDWMARLYCQATGYPPPNLSEKQYVCAQRARNATDLNECTSSS